jgi:CBS domain-containing protein
MRIEQLHPITSTRLRVINTEATLQVAALSLSNPGIGLVIVCNGNGRAAGVLSKSDLIRHLAHREPAEPSTLMSREIISCDPDDDVHDVWRTMVARGLQNVPVLAADSKPSGVLDIRDAMKALFEQEEFQERMLTNYIAGIGYR